MQNKSTSICIWEEHESVGNTCTHKGGQLAHHGSPRRLHHHKTHHLTAFFTYPICYPADSSQLPLPSTIEIRCLTCIWLQVPRWTYKPPCTTGQTLVPQTSINFNSHCHTTSVISPYSIFGSVVWACVTKLYSSSNQCWCYLYPMLLSIIEYSFYNRLGTSLSTMPPYEGRMSQNMARPGYRRRVNGRRGLWKRRNNQGVGFQNEAVYDEIWAWKWQWRIQFLGNSGDNGLVLGHLNCLPQNVSARPSSGAMTMKHETYL